MEQNWEMGMEVEPEGIHSHSQYCKDCNYPSDVHINLLGFFYTDAQQREENQKGFVSFTLRWRFY